MELNEIEGKLRSIVSKHIGHEVITDSISLEESLYEDGLGLDSITLVNFIVQVEKEFEITFEDISAETFSSLKNLAAHIQFNLQN